MSFFSDFGGTLRSTFRINRATLDAAALSVARAITFRDVAGSVAIDGKPRRQSVTFATTMSLDCSLFDVFDITLTGNATINFTNGADGQAVKVRLKQDGTGSRIVTWGSMVRFGSDISGLTLTTAVNKTDHVGLVHHATDSKYDLVAYARGY